MKKKQKAVKYRVMSGLEAPEAMDRALRQLSEQLGNTLLDIDAEADIHDVLKVRFRVNAPDPLIGYSDFSAWLDPVMKKITELVNTNCGGQSIKLHWSTEVKERPWFEISGFLREKVAEKK